jgi:hypothetical protein
VPAGAKRAILDELDGININASTLFPEIESAAKYIMSKITPVRDMLPILNSRRCQLLDIPRLISQLHGLERRTARGGRDSIDHGPGQHDDVANAVAGAIVLASHHARPMNFHPPCTGPSRSEWIAAAGFGHPGGGLPISMADGSSTEKPGGS